MVRPAAEALALAQQLVDDGRPFQAHEVLESSWRAAPPGERELWRGLAQIAVGLTHAQRGNARGAVALLHRGSQRVSEFTGSAAHGVDAAGAAGGAASLAARIERDGLAGAEPGRPEAEAARGGQLTGQRLRAPGGPGWAGRIRRAAPQQPGRRPRTAAQSQSSVDTGAVSPAPAPASAATSDQVSA